MCQSFSTRLGLAPGAAATRSTSRGSGTFEAEEKSVVAELAPDALPHSHHTTGRYLRRAAGVVVLFKPTGRGFNCEALQRFGQYTCKLFKNKLNFAERGIRNARSTY